MSPEGGIARSVTRAAPTCQSTYPRWRRCTWARPVSARLQQAGLVDEATSGTVQRADRAFAVALKPWTPYNF